MCLYHLQEKIKPWSWCLASWIIHIIWIVFWLSLQRPHSQLLLAYVKTWAVIKHLHLIIISSLVVEVMDEGSNSRNYQSPHSWFLTVHLRCVFTSCHWKVSVTFISLFSNLTVPYHSSEYFQFLRQSLVCISLFLLKWFLVAFWLLMSYSPGWGMFSVSRHLWRFGSCDSWVGTFRLEGLWRH